MNKSTPDSSSASSVPPRRTDAVLESDKSLNPSNLRGKPGLSMVGLLLVQMIVGYEWLVSGVAKFERGGFPAGLAKELVEKSADAPAWYGSFLKAAVIPHGVAFGYLIETSEILAGVALMMGSFIWLCAWDRVSERTRAAVLCITAIAGIGATFLVINLHLANGASNPWLIPASGFDEGVDLDSLLPAIQIVLIVVSIITLKRLRRTENRSQTIGAPPAHHR
jgi:uncharacterized membrane protein YphA (DoxX/SURF4 family)